MRRAGTTGAVALAVLFGLVPVGSAGAEAGEPVAPGVVYRQLAVATPQGTARVHLLTVDLAQPGLSVDLLHADAVAARAPLTRLAGERGAVAAVNGDFFHLSELQHPGVAATGAAVGPELAAGRPLKAAVPSAQRFGWALPGGAAVEDVVGVGLDGRARFGRLALAGTVRSPAGAVPLEGLNQYALPVGGVGAFTADWGAASRARAVCGSDVSRAAPCSGETREVTVRRGRVTATVPEPGEGRVAADSVVLVGREAGARYLSGLRVGDPVQLAPHLLDAGGGGLLRWALGSSVILAGGRPVDGLNASVAEPRSCVGIGASGRRLYLLATDGRGGESAGLTVRGLAVLMGELGAESAGQLDGGGSATLVARDVAASGRPAVRNRLDGGAERAVPNGIGVFSPGAGRPGG